MPYRYEFLEAASRDLYKLTRRNQPLLHAVAVVHIPTILRDPQAAGAKKQGDLSNVRAYNLKFDNVADRLIYEIQGDIVLFIAIGPHDAAYERAGRRDDRRTAISSRLPRHGRRDRRRHADRRCGDRG
jgi:mRNA-degrading endonuclease RelE of RelBE toxin-antitoxin system